MTLSFDDIKFQAEFGRIISETRNPRAILLGAGRTVGAQLKRHFRAKDRSESNHLSARRSHFWLTMAWSVQAPVQESPTTISVSISDPRFAQKLFGGTITAKAAGALTIPVEERAYDRTTKIFEAETGLKLFLLKAGGTKSNALENALLAVADPANPGHVTVEYLLTESVDQPADTDALPDKTEMENAVLARSERIMDRQLKNNPQS
jgi:hypothetical protein